MSEITAANNTPALLVLKPTGHGSDEKGASRKKRETESQKELLDKIDTDLGKKSLVKHNI